MMRTVSRFIVATALLPLAACAGTAPDVPAADEGRILSGLAPAGAQEVLVIDADGQAFRAVPQTSGAYQVAIDSLRPISVFVIEDGVTRVLSVARTSGGAPELTSLPAWQGEVSTAQLSTAGEVVVAEENPLDQIDTDEDGESDLDDGDDDEDGVDDDEDGDCDGDGHDDDDDDLDTDNDGAPDLCDDDDDEDGVADEDDADEDDDSDGDGVSDDDDSDDDNDCDGDDEDSDDDGDGEDDVDDSDDSDD